MKKLLAASCCFLTAAWCWLFSATGFAAAPLTPSQLALYQGADREKILVEGAKREGQFTLYTSHTWFRTFVKEFEKKYPFVKANEWRNDSKTLIRKVLEEAKSGRVLVDVVESTADGMGLIKREGLFQEYYSPEARYYPSELKPKGKNGFFYLPNRETYSSLGFNTKLIPPANAPRSLKDLIDPRWKGKMAITGTSTGVRWIGNVLDVMGREFLEKCDLNMPQVYWEQAHNPDTQLARTVEEFANTSLVGYARPVIPTGSAYGTGGWRATPDDLRLFFSKAQSLGLAAANAYSWDWATSAGNTELWDAVANYSWPFTASAPVTTPPTGGTTTGALSDAAADLLTRYFNALNNGDVDALVALYQPNAAHVTAERTVVGSSAIRDYYNDLLTNRLPSANFVMRSSSGHDPTAMFTWTANSSNGLVNDGSDTVGLREGLIQYHYTRFTVA